MRNKKLFIKLLRAYRRGYKRGFDYGQNTQTPIEPTPFMYPPKYYSYYVRQRIEYLIIVRCVSAINIDNKIIFQFGKLYCSECFNYDGEFVVYWFGYNVVFKSVDFLNHFQPIYGKGYKQQHNSNR